MGDARDHYRTLAQEATAELRVQRSRFLGIAFPVATEEELQSRLAALESRYFDATHHCWAFRLITDERSRYSDAGEPGGSAGRPILQAIDSARLLGVGVVVVRWYGGVKLGTGGLSRAYREAARDALAAAPGVDRWIYERFVVSAEHRTANLVFRMIDPPDIVLASSEFGAEARFDLDVRLTLADRFTEQLVANRIEFRRRG